MRISVLAPGGTGSTDSNFRNGIGARTFSAGASPAVPSRLENQMIQSELYSARFSIGITMVYTLRPRNRPSIDAGMVREAGCNGTDRVETGKLRKRSEYRTILRGGSTCGGGTALWSSRMVR